MKFIVTWKTPQSSVVDSQARFLQTGGGPPDGVKMVGRWHGVTRGVAIAETNDAKALFAWLSQWTDLLEMEATPCLEDAEAGEVMSAIQR